MGKSMYAKGGRGHSKHTCVYDGGGGPNFSHFFAYILNEGPEARGVETIVFFWE